MIRQPISRTWYVALGVASFVTLGGLYAILSHVVHQRQPDNKTIPTWGQMYDEGFLPAFVTWRHFTLPTWDWVTADHPKFDQLEGEVVQGAAGKGKIVKTIKDFSYAPYAWIDGQATLGRLLLALVLATVIGVPLGLLMGCYQFAEAYFLPPLAFLAKVPATAMLAVFIVLATTNLEFYTAIVVFGLVPMIAQVVFHAAKEDVPEELLFKARTLGAGQIDCIWEVIFKFILPKVMEAVRLQIGPAIVYLIAAEWASGEVGFGCRMRLRQKSLDMSMIYTYVIALAVFFLLVDQGLIWLQRKLCPWYAQ